MHLYLALQSSAGVLSLAIIIRHVSILIRIFFGENIRVLSWLGFDVDSRVSFQYSIF